MRGITDDELALLQAFEAAPTVGRAVSAFVFRFRSGGWTWGPWRSVNGPPTVYERKRDAAEHLLAFVRVLELARAECAEAEGICLSCKQARHAMGGIACEPRPWSESTWRLAAPEVQPHE